MQPYQSLQSIAYDYLIRMIEQHQLEYRKLYSETKLSRELGISRTPFRDALQRLAQEGYIDIVPSKGFMLHQLSLKDITDTLQIRCAIEGYCIRTLSEQSELPAMQSYLDELRSCLNEQEQIVNNGGSAKDFVRSDAMFHMTIVSSAGNTNMTKLYQSYRHRIDTQVALSFEQETGRMKQTVLEHKAVYDAIQTGSEQSYSTLERHLQQIRNILHDDLN